MLDHRPQLPEIGGQGPGHAEDLAQLLPHLLDRGQPGAPREYLLAPAGQLLDLLVDAAGLGLPVRAGHVGQAAHGVRDAAEPCPGHAVVAVGDLADEPQRPQGVRGQAVARAAVDYLGFQPSAVNPPAAVLAGGPVPVPVQFLPDLLERVADALVEPLGRHRAVHLLEVLG